MDGATVLWVDDDPDQVRPIGKFLSVATPGVTTKVVESLDEAEFELTNNEYGALVADLNMNPQDRYQNNGADWLVDVSNRYKSLPLFVYSAYLTDPLYIKRLNEAYIMLSMSKTDEFHQPYQEDGFLNALGHCALKSAQLTGHHPEDIRFKDYICHPEKYAEDVAVHWDRYGFWARQYMSRNNLQWIVICGETVSRKSEKLSDFPSEDDLMVLGEKKDRIPFAYSRTNLPEQLPWTNTGDGDCYPTLKATIDGNEVVGDFDTGAFQTHVSEDIVAKGVLDFWRAADEAQHLLASYRFFTKKVEIGVSADSGEKRVNGIPVAVVGSWKSSPFVEINSSRVALIGRDVLNELGVQVILDGSTKETHIKC